MYTLQSAALVLGALLSGANGETQITAAGATFPLRLYQSALFAYSFVKPDQKFTYDGVGSGRGICFIKGVDARTSSCPEVADYKEIDWGGSDAAFSDSDYAQVNDLQMYPSVAGAVAVIYNLNGIDRPLNLTGEITARIFRKCTNNTISGCIVDPPSISRWDHPDIVSLNPGYSSQLTAAGEIFVVVRKDKSGTSEIFKKALCAFETNFEQQVGCSASNTGYNADVFQHESNVGVAGFVALTPGSIGYSVLGEAVSIGLAQAQFKKSANSDPVAPNAVSVQNAMVERGLEFGTEHPERLVADISNAVGSQAWPIVGYTYFIIRKENPVSDSERRLATQEFFLWFYESDVVRELAKDLGFAPLTDTIRSKVVERIKQDMKYKDGTIVAKGATYVPRIDLGGVREMNDILQQYRLSYLVNHDNVFGSTLLDNGSMEVLNGLSSLTNFTDLAVVHTSDSNIASKVTALVEAGNHIALPFAGVALGAIVNFCGSEGASNCYDGSFSLSVSTLAKILSGTITNWDHELILNDQADDTVKATFQAAVAGKDIIVIASKESSELKDRFVSLMKEETGMNDFQIKASSAMYEKTDRNQKLSAVVTQAFSIAFTDFVGDVQLTAQVKAVPILRNNVAVAPSYDNLVACIDGINENSWKVDLRSEYSLNQQMCYPLTATLSVITAKEYQKGIEGCDDGAGLGESIAQFVGFVYGSEVSNQTETKEPLRQQGVLPLYSGATTYTKSTIKSISCVIGADRVSILLPDHQYSLIPLPLVYFSYVAVGLCVLSFIFLAYWTHAHRRRKIVVVASPPFMLQILFGATLCVLAIIPLAQQSEGVYDRETGTWDSIPYLDTMCVTAPALYTVGFAILYSSLWLKTWRLEKIFNNPKLKRVYITNKKMQMYQVILLAIVIGLNLLWYFYEPGRLRWERFTEAKDPLTGYPTKSFALCNASEGLIGTPLAAVCIGILLYGLLLVYKSRRIPSEYGEGRHIAMSLITGFESLILGIPILFIAGDNPTARFVVLLAIIAATAFAPVCFLFLPKVVYVLQWGWQTGTSGSGSGGSSPFQQSATLGNLDDSGLHSSSYFGSYNAEDKSYLGHQPVVPPPNQGSFRKNKTIFETPSHDDGSNEEYV